MSRFDEFGLKPSRKILYILCMLLAPPLISAELEPEKLGNVNTLPRTPDPHCLWVSDMVYDYMTDGRASLPENSKFAILF